ncbi:MAG: alanine racemase [Halanaerobiales bacterium]
MADLTVARVNLAQLSTNIEALYSEIDEKMKVLVAVKADAYGHGLEAVSRLLARNRVDYLGVSNIPEALSIREVGVEVPVLVLMPSLPSDVINVINKNIDITITSLKQAYKINELAQARSAVIPVQINIDTGMGRTGFLPGSAKIARIFKKLTELSALEVRGVFSHLSSAHLEDEESREFTVKQVESFSRILDNLDGKELLPLLCHISSSDPLLYCRDLVTGGRFNMIRPGELFYGHNSSLNKFHEDIKPALSVVTKIIEIRNIEANKYIGYGRKYKSKRKMKTGLIPLGYAGGLDYRLSNTGQVIVKGKKAAIMGEICMNETLIDLTDHEQVEEGEEVLILGEELTADKIGARAGMHATEVLTLFSGIRHIYSR